MGILKQAPVNTGVEEEPDHAGYWVPGTIVIDPINKRIEVQMSGYMGPKSFEAKRPLKAGIPLSSERLKYDEIVSPEMQRTLEQWIVDNTPEFKGGVVS